MSLEQALADNTAAVLALTKAFLSGGAPAAIPTTGDPADAAEKPAATAGRAGGTKGTPVRVGPSAEGKGKGKAKAEDAEPDAGGMTAEQLTKVIVKAVAATDADQVKAILKKDFGVSAGKEITDPAVRQELADKLQGLIDGDAGDEDLS
mgnify:CR=1 FL=1